MIHRSSTRVFVNTVIQYVRSVISILILLYTSRLVLSALGVEDFGIYSLIAGIISLLAFIKDSLASTVQRYLSFYQGRKDMGKQTDILSNCFFIQLVISAFLVIVLWGMEEPILRHLLKISPDRLDAAEGVYYCMLFMLFFTMQSAPYFALLIAHENMVYTSFVQIIDVLLKLFISISLSWFSWDKLLYYACSMSLVSLLDYACYSFYCKRKYEELKGASILHVKKKVFKEMFSFTGWNIYSVGCIVGRTQGISVLLNRFMGVALNAAYGIAQQVTGQITFLSSSLLNALQPQIVTAEGEGDRDKMFRYSEMASKFSFFLIGFVTVPSLFYMDRILSLWLGNVPDYAVMCCSYVLFAAWMDQLTIGLGVANKALGKIKLYSIVVNTVKVLTVPVAYIGLRNGFSVNSVFVYFVVFEFICALSRLIMLKYQGGLSIIRFCKNVFVYEMLPIAVLVTVSWICVRYVINDACFLLTYFVVGVFFSLSIYFVGLTTSERMSLKSLFYK